MSVNLSANHVSANYVRTKKLCVGDIEGVDVLAELKRLQARVNELERQLSAQTPFSAEIVSVEVVDEKMGMAPKDSVSVRTRADRSA